MVKLAGMQESLSDSQADCTLFVPDDRSIAPLGDGVFLNMDKATAISIIKSSMLNRKITSDLLEDSPAAYFITRNPAKQALRHQHFGSDSDRQRCNCHSERYVGW